MRRGALLTLAASAAAMLAGPAFAQDLNDRPKPPPPPPAAAAAPADADQITFDAGTLSYDSNADIVTATGDVRMFRGTDRLRADTVVWNRKTGKVTATGNVAVTNPQGDIAYGDSIDLTDTLKDGVVRNMLIVLHQGGRLAADTGTRSDTGTIVLTDAAYTPCDVTDSDGCPKRPSWQITAVSIRYDPDRGRIFYRGGHFRLFSLPPIPLPPLSIPLGGVGNASGLLEPRFQFNRSNGFEVAVPYLFDFAPNRQLTVTPHVFTATLPMLQLDYQALDTHGAFHVSAYGTYSRRSDDDLGDPTATSEEAFRGYLDGVGRYQLDPNWSVSGSIRLVTDKTFLRRYDISQDDRVRSTIAVERIDDDSYLSIDGWVVQTLRLDDRQGMQPIALPEIDYRRRAAGPLGGTFTFQLNSLALDRTEGQDTQRAFASAEWDLRKLTRWGQQVTFTAFARGDVYHTDDTLATSVPSYRGDDGFDDRVIGALAIDVQWPLVGGFLSGTQRLTPRFQVVASPRTANLSIPDEDARAVDLEDSNLFALNRFPGYDRWEDSTRFTYGLDWNVDLPRVAIAANVGQSYRLDAKPDLFPDGTGLNDRVSDIVGRWEVRYGDLVSVIDRFRLDKDDLAIRRNELDATIGSRASYLLVGYINLNRNIFPDIEDLQDIEELRLGARVQFGRFWSAFGSTVVDLSNSDVDPTLATEGFDPVRHRLGVAYEDNCIKLGLTWKRDYDETGDARGGNSYLLTLAFKNIGR